MPCYGGTGGQAGGGGGKAGSNGATGVGSKAGANGTATEPQPELTCRRTCCWASARESRE